MVAETHPPIEFNILGSGSRQEEAELKRKRLNFSSSQENGIIQFLWVGNVSVTLCNVCHWVTVGGRYTSSLWKFKQFCRSIKNKLV